MGCGGQSMKKAPLNFFGIPTLISILILVMMYSLVSVLVVKVQKQHESLLQSYRFIEDSYTLETQATQQIHQIQLTLLLSEDPQAWLEAQKEYDSLNQQLSFTLTHNNQRLEWVGQIETNPLRLTILKERLDVINTQDYSQNGHDVYGGTP